VPFGDRRSPAAQPYFAIAGGCSIFPRQRQTADEDPALAGTRSHNAAAPHFFRRRHRGGHVRIEAVPKIRKAISGGARSGGDRLCRPVFYPGLMEAAEPRSLGLRQKVMEERQIRELAAILVKEHREGAVAMARRRQAQYAGQPGSELFLLWRAIARAAARLLRRDARRRAPPRLSGRSRRSAAR
jgi:hypothetical protein